jgi:acyl-CoA thioester hydrolase
VPPNPFKTALRVTWADIDAAQVVNFSKFFAYFGRTEEEFYRSLGLSFTDLRERGFWLPRVEAFCQYRQPARFDDVLEVDSPRGKPRGSLLWCFFLFFSYVLFDGV